MRQLTSEADARWSLRVTWAVIDELYQSYSGCDWCCGGGNEHMRRLGEEAAAIEAWLREHGFIVPIHPEDCPVLNARFHQWAEACNTFQDGWFDWYKNNQPIYP